MKNEIHSFEGIIIDKNEKYQTVSILIKKIGKIIIQSYKLSFFNSTKGIFIEGLYVDFFCQKNVYEIKLSASINEKSNNYLASMHFLYYMCSEFLLEGIAADDIYYFIEKLKYKECITLSNIIYIIILLLNKNGFFYSNNELYDFMVKYKFNETDHFDLISKNNKRALMCAIQNCIIYNNPSKWTLKIIKPLIRYIYIYEIH